jgi:hypothetical protein
LWWTTTKYLLALWPRPRPVFVAAFQQDTGETAGELNALFPGSMLTPATTVAREHPGGTALSLLEIGDDGVPDRGVGEGAVDEHDGRGWCGHGLLSSEW